jgi:hypothetical protein
MTGLAARPIRLLFAGGGAVVIALGEMRNAAVEYQPDRLVVLFDEGQADAYREEYQSLAGIPPGWEPVTA